MYFPDLSLYSYLGKEPDPSLLNIGWLDIEHEFARGTVSEKLLRKVRVLCFKRVNQMRGFHYSQFLEAPLEPYQIEFEGRKMGLGSAEIRVPGSKGISYAAPNLIYHYIKDVGYLPPDEFLQALEAMGHIQ